MSMSLDHPAWLVPLLRAWSLPNLLGRVTEQGWCWVCPIGASAERVQFERVGLGRTSIRLQNLVWELVHERPVPSGYWARCCFGTAGCAHPDHLMLVAQAAERARPRPADVVQRICETKRAASKITDADVRSILRSAGSHARIARRYKVSAEYIGQIRAGKVRRLDRGAVL